ncbi:MAG: GTP-binding protein [Synechococcus sp.]|nr:GTP-binding protein [Synechococcus sp.]
MSLSNAEGRPVTLEQGVLWLERWRNELNLSGRERDLLAGSLTSLDRQLKRVREQHLRVAVFGRVGVGKSSLVNALVGAELLATDVAHGCTRHQQAVPWPERIQGLHRVDLVDTPGIDEVSAAARGRLAARVALQADLVLLVLDADISRVELEALDTLVASGKPLLTVLNRSDCWSERERSSLIASISSRIRSHCGSDAVRGMGQPIAVAAAPRQASQRGDGLVRSSLQPARVDPLRQKLHQLLQDRGMALLTLNALRQAERLQRQVEQGRLQRRRREAQGLIGRFAALKATGVAVNPLVLLDLAGGMACDTALVMQLCELYELPMGGPAARRLLQRLSGHNALIGGVQLGIQAALSGVRQLLLAAAPFTAGISLAPAAPVALAQAALAVHTTRQTGQLTAQWLLEQRGRGRRSQPVPTSLLRRLAGQDHKLRLLLQDWPHPPKQAAMVDVLP